MSKMATPEGKSFLDTNAAKEGVTTTATGLQISHTKPGEGKTPAASDSVRVHYRGKLIDGTTFDSSYDRGMPIDFPLSGVIAGWTEALQLMQEKGKAQVVIPPELGYGERGAGGVIPPNAVLVFDIELLSVL